MKKLGTNITHGMRYTRFYGIWKGMNGRCNVKTNKAYKGYGSVGIKNKWERFEDFKEDMYESYLEHVEKYGEKQTSIDRIDNKGNYCKQNCRWRTLKQQSENRSISVKVVHEGKEISLKDISNITGVSYHTIYKRYFGYKWPVERLFEKTYRGRNQFTQ